MLPSIQFSPVLRCKLHTMTLEILVVDSFHRGMVYEDANKLYSEVRRDCYAMLDKALGVLLAGTFPAFTGSLSAKNVCAVLAFNPTPFPRQDVIEFPYPGDGSLLSTSIVQTSLDGKSGYALINCQEHELVGQPTEIPTHCGPVSGMWSFLLIA